MRAYTPTKRIAISVAILGFATLFSACGSTGSTGSGTANATATPIPTGSSLYTQFTQKWASLNDMTMTLTSQSSTGTTTMNGKYILHPSLSFDANVSVEGKQTEVIMTNNQIYMKMAIPPSTTSEWYSFPANSSITSSIVQSGNSVSQTTNMTSISLVGKETINGIPCWHLQGTANGDATDLWMRIDNGYPVRIKTVAQSGTSTVIDVSAWNSGVTITPPTSATPFPSV